jgi:hypothetical protein
MLVKRFQIRSKCIDTTEAKFYMEQSNYNIEDGKKIFLLCLIFFFFISLIQSFLWIRKSAVQLYRDDILWEMQHPMKEKSNLIKSKKNRRKVG